MPTIRYLSLAAGEVSDRLAARVDQVKYQTGARVMRNMVPTLEGACQNRSGIGYVRPAHNFTGDNPPRMLPFVYSDSESHIIVLEDGALSIISSATPQFETAVNISAITQANPCHLTTSAPHGLTTGNLVWIDGVGGMTQLNRRFFRAVVIDADEFTLQEETGSSVNSTGYGAFTAAGTVSEVFRMDAPWDGADLRKIRYAQSGDVMLLACEGYPTQRLTLSAGPTWTLEAVVLQPDIDRPTGGSGAGAAGAATVRYRVVAVREDTFEKSYAGIGDLVAVTTVDETAPDATKVITSVTQATPPVVTCAAHGYTAGQLVQIVMTSGALQATGYWEVYDVGLNTFKLRRNGVNVNGNGWTSGVDVGTVRRVYRIAVTTATHGLVDDDEVTFFDLEAPFEDLNGRPFIVDVLTATTFALKTEYGTTTQSDSPAAANVARSAIAVDSVLFPTSADPITVTWEGVPNALEYLVFREINGIYGFLGSSASESFEDEGYPVDPYDTPPVDRDVFAGEGLFPVCVGLFQQRVLYGGGEGQDDRVDAGKTGTLNNFTRSNPIQADDSFSWRMRGNQKQGVRHIVEMSRCLIFTQSSVYTLEGDEAGALVPSAVNPRLRAEHGVGDIAPIPVGNAVLYVQASGKVVREILPGDGDDFNAKDMTVYSRHLFDRNSIIAWAYAEEPTSIMWSARDDGAFLSFTYQREHQVEGWSRHDTGDGDKVVDVCCVPEGNETATYMVVRRFGVGAGDRYYIERMATRQVAHAADGKFLDSYRFYEDENADVAATMTLAYGDDHTDDDQWTLTNGGTADAWVIGDVGRVFLLYGSDGERFWCTVSEYIDADHVIVDMRSDVRDVFAEDGSPNDDDVEEEVGVPFPLTLPFTTAEWSQSAASITDLWHLNGREVYVVGDGLPQGPFTVTAGAITLEAPAVLVVVGLQIIADLEPNEPENPEGPDTWADRTKTVGKVTVRVQETDGLQVGLSVAGLQEFIEDWKEPDTHREGFLYTGRITVENMAASTPKSRVLLRQSSGLPTTILGIYAQVDIGDR